MKRRIVTLGLALLAIAGSAFSADSQPRYLEITFLSTNDIHSRVLPFDTPGNPPVKNIGGAARRSTIVNRVRAEMLPPVFLFDSGDTTYRTSYIGKTFKGEADMAVMNAMGYDALVPGNHDFEYSGADIKRIMSQANFPWICANLVSEKTGEPFFKPYVIIEVGGLRVAVFGVITAHAMGDPKLYIGVPDLGVKVVSAVDAAETLVPELRKQADIVVMLSHLGTSEDVQLVQSVPGIDIVLGGHSHTLLRTPRMTPVGQPTAFWLGAVPVVQAGAYGEWMGRTKLIFHRDAALGRYTLMSCRGEMIHIDSSIPDDPAIIRVMDNLKTRVPASTH